MLIGFYHPFCNGGGGGERVLWKVIETLAKLDPSSKSSVEQEDEDSDSDIDYVAAGTISIQIYTCDPTPLPLILANVLLKFQITIPSTLSLSTVLVPNGASLLSAASYPRFTMVGQSLGAMFFAYKALLNSGATPDVFFDTTGCAFTFPVAKLFSLLTSRKNCRVLTYTHYPTISTDMLNMVYERRPSYNNSTAISTSVPKNTLKLLYYILFALIYGVVGSFADFVMVNSTWTRGHIKSLWLFAPQPEVLYPPCDAKGFAKLPLEGSREPIILSIGQFRPEKDHQLQIRSFAALLKSEPPVSATTRLVLLGGVRDAGDQARVDELRLLCASLGVEDRVTFAINEPYSVLKKYLAESSVGLHSMWNEHFGIGVVEMMAAGLVTIAHNSGGPKADIVQDNGRVGFLATTEAEYCAFMHRAIMNEGGEMDKLRENARESAFRFSDEVFEERLEGFLLEKLD